MALAEPRAAAERLDAAADARVGCALDRSAAEGDRAASETQVPQGRAGGPDRTDQDEERPG